MMAMALRLKVSEMSIVKILTHLNLKRIETYQRNNSKPKIKYTHSQGVFHTPNKHGNLLDKYTPTGKNYLGM